MSSVLRLVSFAAAVVAVVALSPVASAISPEAGYVQLQLAKLLFTDGRYLEAFAAFEQVKDQFPASILVQKVGRRRSTAVLV